MARVDYKDYVGPLKIGERIAQEAISHTETVMTSGQYQYYCLTVHAEGRW